MYIVHYYAGSRQNWNGKLTVKCYDVNATACLNGGVMIEQLRERDKETKRGERGDL